MDCNQHKHLYISPFSVISTESFFYPRQMLTLSGRAIESLAVNQAQKSIEAAYSQTIKLLEEVDTSIARASYSVDSSLRFPFDVMDHVTRTASDNWRVLMGGKTTAEIKLAEQIENQEILSSRIENQLKAENALLIQSVSEKDETLLLQQSESDKARKAKLSAQRAQRKLKAELQATSDEALTLKAERDKFTERYDQQLSDNLLLQAQNTQLELELAKARQEEQLRITDSEQLAAENDALTAEQAKLIAEKDGLHKRIEELQRQLEHSSNYTE